MSLQSKIDLDRGMEEFQISLAKGTIWGDLFSNFFFLGFMLDRSVNFYLVYEFLSELGALEHVVSPAFSGTPTSAIKAWLGSVGERDLSVDLPSDVGDLYCGGDCCVSSVSNYVPNGYNWRKCWI